MYKLDFGSFKYGESGHIEQTWSYNVYDKIYQLYFQLVRSDDQEQMNKLENILQELLMYLFSSNYTIQKYKNEISNLYKLVGHTRDIIKGKGERKLTYMQIYQWYLISPNLAFYLIESCVDSLDKVQHPYGSWKDVKYIADYVYQKTKNKDHPIINFMIGLCHFHIKKDYQDMLENKPISLIAKWMPRKSLNNKKYDWFFEKLAYYYYQEYIATSNKNTIHKAKRKCEMNMRKTLSSLNKYSHTLEIKLTDKKWRYIDFNEVPSLSMNKYYYSFLNETKLGNVKYDNNDRKMCSEKFKDFIDNKTNINVSKITPYYLVKEVVKNKLWDHCRTNSYQRKLLNKQWNSYVKSKNIDIKNIIPMIDLSYSMEKEANKPLYTSIAMGILISEINNNIFKNRVLTFDSNPSWIKFNEEQDFCDKVKKIIDNRWGCEPNLYKSCRLILDTITKHNIRPKELKNLTIAIFSNMQINDNCPIYLFKSTNILYNNIKSMFINIGVNNTNNKSPYPVPHILFWNLISGDGFPCAVSTYNSTMLSGYNDNLLKYLTFKKSKHNLKYITPTDMINEILSQHRYYFLEKKLFTELQFYN